MPLKRVGPNWIRGANSRTTVRKSKAASWPDVVSTRPYRAAKFCGHWIDEQVIAIDGGWTSTLSEGAMMASRTMVKRRFRYSGKLVSV